MTAKPERVASKICAASTLLARSSAPFWIALLINLC